jgi:transposase InsO family protein
MANTGRRYTEEQITAILMESEVARSAAEVIRRHGVTAHTFYRRKVKYAGMEVSDARRLKQPKRRRSAARRQESVAATGTNQLWAMDFMSDALADGWMLRVLPAVIHVDNGTDFTLRLLDQWAYPIHVKLDFSWPGKPTDNAFFQSFNAQVRR